MNSTSTPHFTLLTQSLAPGKPELLVVLSVSGQWQFCPSSCSGQILQSQVPSLARTSYRSKSHLLYFAYSHCPGWGVFKLPNQPPISSLHFTPLEDHTALGLMAFYTLGAEAEAFVLLWWLQTPLRLDPRYSTLIFISSSPSVFPLWPSFLFLIP